MSQSPPLIPPLTAQYSIAIWSLSGLLCLPLLLVRLGPHAFPRSKRHRFIASDSSLRYVRIRARLLFALGVAILVDALNNAVHYTLAWQCATYHTLAHRLVLPVSFSVLPPLAVLSLCYRCAVVVVSNRVQRMRYVKFSQCACFLAWGLHASGVLALTHSMVVDRVPASVLLVERWVPIWGTFGVSALPVLAVSGSVWSLRTAYHGRRMRRRQRAGPDGLAIEEKDAKSAHRHGGQMDEGGSACRPSLQGSTIGSAQEGSDCSSESRVPANAFLLKTSSSHPPATGPFNNPSSTTVPILSLQRQLMIRPPTTQINYPLTQTFRILTYGVFITWIATTVLLLFPMVGPIRNNALFNLLMTLNLALESSFERLLKIHNRRNGVQRRGGGGEEERGQEMAKGGNGMMIGESVLDVAGGAGIADDGARIGNI